jgi:prepilin-type N-terminal cleavage/methylation domain-containing protein/prepilin-type processing-associated H-X9-DG protein
MSQPQPSSDFVKSLIEQDAQLNAANFDDQRRRILQQLADAERKEKCGRKIALLAAAVTALILIAIFAATAQLSATMAPEKWPEWLAITFAAIFILSPTTALLIAGIYFVRHRRDFLRLRREAYQQSLLSLPKQIEELRRTIDDLKRKQSGFTIMELMVSISILAILASLLLPALSGAKAKTKSIVCQQNLAQIGRALVMYEGDFHYYPGSGDAAIINKVLGEWFKPSTNSWIARLRQFAPNEKTFICSEYTPPIIDGHSKLDAYGYNAGGSSAIYAHMDLDLGLGHGESNFVSAAQIRAPSEMVALGDVQMPDSVWCTIVTPHEKPIGRLIPIPSRHRGGANMLFTDTHTEFRKQSVWTRRAPNERARWNIDHQPHPETW